MTTPPRRARLLASTAVVVVLGCRARPPSPPSPTAVPSERDLLLERIRALAAVEPCLVDGGAEGIRLVDAEVAGEVATATFACANGAASGKVTFFRIAGTWTVSTKEIAVLR